MFKNTLRVIDKIKRDIQIASIALEIIINLTIIGLNVYTLYDFIVHENILGAVITILLLVSLVFFFIMKLVIRKNKSNEAKTIKKEAKKYYKFFKKLKRNADKIIQTIIAFMSFTTSISKILIIPILIMIALPFILNLSMKYVASQIETFKNAFMEDIKEPFEAAGETIGNTWSSIFKKKEKKSQLADVNATIFDESDLIAFDEVSS